VCVCVCVCVSCRLTQDLIHAKHGLYHWAVPPAIQSWWWPEAISGVHGGLKALVLSPRSLNQGDWTLARPQKPLKEMDEDKVDYQGLDCWVWLADYLSDLTVIWPQNITCLFCSYGDQRSYHKWSITKWYVTFRYCCLKKWRDRAAVSLNKIGKFSCQCSLVYHSIHN
jgi:hypothetical protein